MEQKDVQKNPMNAKKVALFILYAFLAVCLLVTVLSFNDLPSIFEQLRTIDARYVCLAALSVLIYMALYPLSLCILTKAKGTRVSMPMAYSIAMIEHFFNGITPLATGGQPFQAHMFTKAKVKLSESTGLLLTNLIIYFIVTTGFSIVGLVYADVFVSAAAAWWIPIIVIGYVLNAMVLVVMVLLGTSRRLRSGLVRFLTYLCKFRIFSFLPPKIESLQAYFEQVQEAFRELTRKKWSFVLALISKILSFAFLYATTFFILRAMHISVPFADLCMVLLGTSFAVTAVGFVPTPGASGGVEGSAGQVFKSIILFVVGSSIVSTASAIANGVMLIWRLLSYYFVMLLSLLFYVGLELYFSKKAKKETVVPPSDATDTTAE